MKKGKILEFGIFTLFICLTVSRLLTRYLVDCIYIVSQKISVKNLFMVSQEYKLHVSMEIVSSPVQ
jgi:hypothetical protein